MVDKDLFFLDMAMIRSDMTLLEVPQRALDSFYIRNIWLLYIGVFFCKPDMVSVSILVE